MLREHVSINDSFYEFFGTVFHLKMTQKKKQEQLSKHNIITPF